MRTQARTIEDYLAELPAERRAALERLRALVNARLPQGYQESLNWGMIAYEVPLSMSGRTYNGQPLMIAALASQKRHMSLYLCGLYCVDGLEGRFRDAFAAGGRRLDMGKACVRFRDLADLDLDAVAEVLASVTPDALIAASNAAHARQKG